MTKKPDADAAEPGRTSRGGVEFAERLGGLIRTFRRRARLTQAQVAVRAGLDRNYLRAIEKGVANPSLKVLTALARVLDLRITVESPADPRGVETAAFPLRKGRT
jgi:transcriptional regulator with XRE-family HTH domain